MKGQFVSHYIHITLNKIQGTFPRARALFNGKLIMPFRLRGSEIFVQVCFAFYHFGNKT